TCQRRQYTQICHITTGKQQGFIATGKSCEFFFQLMMWSTMAGNQMGSSAAHTILVSPALKHLHHFGMIGKTQVIIGAKGNADLLIYPYLHALRTVEDTALAIKMRLPTLGQSLLKKCFQRHKSGARV